MKTEIQRQLATAISLLRGIESFVEGAVTIKATPGARHPFESGDAAHSVREIAKENHRAVSRFPFVTPEHPAISTCEICGGNHANYTHQWESRPDDAALYSEPRTEK